MLSITDLVNGLLKKRNRQFGGKFDPFKGSRLGYLTNKFKSFAKFGRRVLRQAFN